MSRMTGHQQTDDAHESTRKLTYADFVKFPSNDRRRHELIDGVHVVTASPATRHQIVLARLTIELGNYFKELPVGSRKGARNSLKYLRPSLTSLS